MQKVWQYLRLYLAIIYFSVKAKAVYRVNFLIGMIQSFIVTVLMVSFFWLIMNRFKDINGWGAYEIIFMYGLAKLSMSLSLIFFIRVWMMDYLINTGELDRVLLRPKSSLFLFAMQDFNIMGLSDAFFGIAIMVYILGQTGFPWHVLNIMLLLAFVASSAIIFSALLFITGIAAFWFLQSSSTREFLIMVYSTFNPYPVSIFGKGIQYMLSFALPFAFVYYYPALYFFNKTDPLFPQWIMYLSPLLAGLFIAAGAFFWKLGLRQYQSSGT